MTEKDKKAPTFPDRMIDDGTGLRIVSLGDGELIDFSPLDADEEDAQPNPKPAA